METFWFFWLRFRRAYASAYDSDFWFSLGHKRSYDSAYDSDSDSVPSENEPLGIPKKVVPFSYNCLMNDIVIAKSASTKYLGVTITNNLNWN